jgi:anti-anti-sigma factor
VLTGELDLADRERLLELLRPAEAAEDVVIDVREVPYMDSTALGCLVRLKRKQLERGNGSVRLTNVEPTVERLLRLTGLDQLFEITND